MSFTLRQLEYVVAVARTRSFSRAAETCHVSQPGLSQQILQLERVLGAALFERTRKGALLTPAGRLVVERSEALLAEARGLEELRLTFGEPLTGDLRLGVIPTIAPYAVPTAAAHLSRVRPGLRLLLYEDRTPNLVQALDRGDFDVLLLALESDLGGAVAEPLMFDPFVFVAPVDHPLAQRDALDARDLQAHDVMLLEDGHCLRDQALEICHASQSIERPDFRASSVSTLVQMVAMGMASTLLPRIAIDREVGDSTELAIVPFSDPAPGRTIALAWRSSSPRSDEFRVLAQDLRTAWGVD